ncbi:MAG: hypothetical protein OEY86_16040, partial [Nitrospira sp.]|nr:hypothetical protein [Nitrospira sp.]
MREKEIRTTYNTDTEKDIAEVDVDTDDPQASDLLEVIGRDRTRKSSEKEDEDRSTLRTSHGTSPFLMESLYFRSFGRRPLLTRAEEIAIAKRIDQGTQRVRNALRRAVKALAFPKRTPALADT